MIGRLRGELAEVGEEDALIDVGGVGYVVRCGSRTLSRMPAMGEEVLVHVETQTAEQTGARLYGFLTREERRAFVLLQSVQGVGPKLAARIVAELKDKPIADGPVAAFHAEARAPAMAPVPTASGEAVAALMGLGVAETVARRAVEHAGHRLGEAPEVPALVKAALQELGR